MNNKIYRAFDAVRAEDALKARTASFLEQRVYQKRRAAFRWQRAVPALCCALLVLLCAGGSVFYATPVAAISVDAAPSVELEINAFDRVIAISCYDDASQETVQSLGLLHMGYDEAVRALLALESTEAQAVSVSVSAGDDAKSDAICRQLESDGMTCSSTNSTEVQIAHEAGISFGKYRAFLELQALDPSVTVEEIRDLPMSAIRQRIAALADSQADGETSEDTESAAPSPSSEATAAHGQGNGTGNGHSGGQHHYGRNQG